MLWILLAALLVMWALGLGLGVAGNLVHILLALALVVLVIQVIQRRRVLQ
ncbi:MAG: lmo0937 family membrane protein [Planctomycetota bacterium]|nr:MAG: lmo0937 family membrane protein [Planctomycetota bacterium]